MTSDELNADAVADLVGWQVNTVYRNRGRTVARQARGADVRAWDFPTGRYTDDGLRWSRDEITAYETARAKYRARGGRPRARTDRAATATGESPT